MSRTLTLLFRRDPSRDRHNDQIHYEGYQAHWPDGGRVNVGLDAFCKHGQRLLGLGKHLKGSREKLINMICFPQDDRETPIVRLPGHRVRRFYLERSGSQGRIFFMDGTPTTIVFDLTVDEHRVCHWIGLTSIGDGECQWFDLAATAVETPVPVSRGRLVAVEV